MKRSVVILVMAASFLCTGCDFFRTLAGRPTSEDIENRKIELLRQQEALAQARLDSLKREQQAVKYGEEIGFMLQDIKAGGWIHNHVMGCERGKK